MSSPGNGAMTPPVEDYHDRGKSGFLFLSFVHAIATVTLRGMRCFPTFSSRTAGSDVSRSPARG